MTGRTVASESGRTCETCGAGLDGNQRYCLNCGGRAVARSPELLELKRRAVATENPPQATPASSPAANSPQRTLRPPTRRVWALLALVFLGFGTLLGGAAGSRSGHLAADVGPPLKLIVPQRAQGVGGTDSTPTAGPPEAEAETTPEAASERSSTTASKKSAVTEKESEPTETEGSETNAGKQETGSGKPATTLPAFKHVFLILLSDEPYAADFGPESKAHYLAVTLEKKGELLLRYDAVAHQQLANEIALISGQGPTVQTAANCQTYAPVSLTGEGPDGQALGTGCVYPASTQTVGDQLAAAHLKWKAYIEGIDEPGAAAPACAHPLAGGLDTTFETGAYATFRDPFVYFESVVSSSACASEIVGLGSLTGDLASSTSTPNLSYIVPDRCHDAGPAPCTPGATAGPADADGFLESVVPKIMASKAYKSGGLLVITSDEAPSSGEFADSSSCCGQPVYPNLPTVEGHGRGGGVVGALLISPYAPEGEDERGTLQPLFAAANDRGHVQTGAPRLCRTQRRQAARAGPVHRCGEGLSATRRWADETAQTPGQLFRARRAPDR